MWKTTIFHDVVYPSLTETETMRRETELHNQNVHFQSQSLRFCEFMASPGQSHNFVSCSENSDSEIFLTDLRKMLKKKLAFCIIKNLLKFSGFTFYHCVLIITRN